SVAIFASGNVNLTAHHISSNTGTTPGTITIVAGANIVATGAAAGESHSTTFGNQISGGTVKVTGASATGGTISCGGCTLSSFAAGTAKPGNILLAAYSGSGGGSGGNNFALDPANAIDASAVGAKGGNVTMIGAGLIFPGNINVSGNAGGGNVTI